MFPRSHELILKEKVRLYDNIAQVNDCQGRLLAELQIYPTPSLNWEFEIIGEVQCNFPHANSQDSSTPINSIEGYSFTLEHSYVSSNSEDVGPLRAARGVANRAIYGDINSPAHKFIFCLPNTRFQSATYLQDKLLKIVQEQATERVVRKTTEGHYIDLALDDTWNVRLEVGQDALNWLNSKNRNIGTSITDLGELYQPRYNAGQPETFAQLQSVTLAEALERLNYLAMLLSYLNGGFTAPLYVEGRQYTEEREVLVQTTSVIIQAHPVTSLDRLGSSWNTTDSDLAAYVGCLSTFERMMQHQFWQDTFDFFLIKYFQAIQNYSWQVVASEIGSVLQRLSYTILFEEEPDARRRKEMEELSLKAGITRLLERIGVTQQRGHNDTDDIPAFIHVRNDSVHPIVRRMTLADRWRSIRQAIQWTDEVMLWRLGYSGCYLDRRQRWQTSIQPRYDLNSRSPNW